MDAARPIPPPLAHPSAPAGAATRPRAEATRPFPERASGAPALWDLLTPEERAFFSQQLPNAVTYRPAGVVRETPGPTGQRVDRTG